MPRRPHGSRESTLVRAPDSFIRILRGTVIIGEAARVNEPTDRSGRAALLVIVSR